MKMSRFVFKRGMMLTSFCCCCAALALLLAAISTQHWIVGRAHRLSEHTNESDGRIQLGLFYGLKNLNVGYGWRSSDINVVQLLNEDRNFMSYGLWIATIGCVSLGILFAVLSAVFALVNTAATPAEAITGIPGLYIWNSCAFLSNIGAVITWSIQYHLRLRRNILSVEDRSHLWNSEGLAVLGYSFWFVVGASLINVMNIVLIFFGSHQSNRDREKTLRPAQKEKSNGAIMLY